jgi:branched-subunit amino acid aminotransferase/4-amino-4-deoxychorismate lyase
MVLHYGQAIFEGLKAYRRPDGSIASFRPEANAARFRLSAQRIAMPELPDDLFLESIRRLVAVDERWVPSAAGNYAASLVAQAQAAEKGCDQVVWLDAVERRWVEEMGGMNLFFVLGSGADARVVTPELTGTLLPGITRDSLLRMAADLGLAVEERRISTEEWEKKAESGELTEVFACGTAAVITPIGTIKSPDFEFTVADGGSGEVTMGLRKELVDIQRGRAADPFGWVHRVL